jgi:hypothetical protein
VNKAAEKQAAMVVVVVVVVIWGEGRGGEAGFIFLLGVRLVYD